MGLLLVQQQAVYREVQSMRLRFKIEAAQLAAVCTTTQQTHTVIDLDELEEKASSIDCFQA